MHAHRDAAQVAQPPSAPACPTATGDSTAQTPRLPAVLTGWGAPGDGPSGDFLPARLGEGGQGLQMPGQRGNSPAQPGHRGTGVRVREGKLAPPPAHSSHCLQAHCPLCHSGGLRPNTPQQRVLLGWGSSLIGATGDPRGTARPAMQVLETCLAHALSQGHGSDVLVACFQTGLGGTRGGTAPSGPRQARSSLLQAPQHVLLHRREAGSWGQPRGRQAWLHPFCPGAEYHRGPKGAKLGPARPGQGRGGDAVSWLPRAPGGAQGQRQLGAPGTLGQPLTFPGDSQQLGSWQPAREAPPEPRGPRH